MRWLAVAVVLAGCGASAIERACQCSDDVEACRENLERSIETGFWCEEYIEAVATCHDKLDCDAGSAVFQFCREQLAPSCP